MLIYIIFFSSYPLINLPPIGNSLEQFSQNEKTFDGLDAEITLKENFQYSKLNPDGPAWVPFNLKLFYSYKLIFIV